MLNMFDVSNIWHVPLVLEAQGAHESVCNILKLGGYDNMNLTGAPPHALSPAGKAAPGVRPAGHALSRPCAQAGAPRSRSAGTGWPSA